MAIYPVLYINQLANDEILHLTSPDLVFRTQAAMREPYLWRTANMSWSNESSLNKSNPIQSKMFDLQQIVTNLTQTGSATPSIISGTVLLIGYIIANTTM